MSSLYELSKEVKALEDLYLNSINEETGEIKDIAVIEELEVSLQEQIKNKGAGLIKMFRNSKLMLESIDIEIERLNNIKKRIKAKDDFYNGYIIKNMEAMGIKKIETELGNLSLRASKSTEIYDEKLIDKRFITIETKEKISKTEIKKAIENGEEVQGARIVEKNSLIIK